MPFRSSLLIAGLASLVVVPSAGAQAAYSTLPPTYGGGAIVGSGLSAASGTFTIGLGHATGPYLAVRVSVVLPCHRRGDSSDRGSDLTVRTRLAADGSFHVAGAAARTTGEVGRAKLWVDGKLTPTGADGTARIRTSMGCGEQTRRWTARPVDPHASPSGPPAPADGMLYGATGEADGAPHGVVAQLAAGRLRIYFSYHEHCDGRDRKGRYTIDDFVQQTYPPLPVSSAAHIRLDQRVRPDALARRQGWTGGARRQFSGNFAGTALYGTFLFTSSYRRGRSEYERCHGGHPFWLVP